MRKKEKNTEKRKLRRHLGAIDQRFFCDGVSFLYFLKAVKIYRPKETMTREKGRVRERKREREREREREIDRHRDRDRDADGERTARGKDFFCFSMNKSDFVVS